MIGDQALNIPHGTRRIHLDFHNPSWVERIGQNFDGKRLAETLKIINSGTGTASIA
jgi:hypothetical protein